MTSPLRLVAATDFSLDARRACRRAALLAREHRAPLTLLHVVDAHALATLAGWLQGKADVGRAMAEQARIQLSVAADEVRQQVGVDPHAKLREGAPLAQLSAAGADGSLLVLGARGAHPMRELAIGTTADRLLRKAQSPLLVVKAEPASAYRKVLALVDFSASSQAALALGLRLAPRASLKALHAFELPYEGKLFLAGVDTQEILGLRAKQRLQALAQFKSLFEGLGADPGQATFSVEHGDVRQQAMEAVKEFAPDLIVVGKQGQSALEDFLLGSVTRAMLSQAPCDVLVAPQGTGARGASGA